MDEFSDINISDEEQSSMDVDIESQIANLFHSDSENDKSFSGFEAEVSEQSAETVKFVKPQASTNSGAKTQKKVAKSSEKGPGKGPGRNLKGKAPAKRKSGGSSSKTNPKVAKINNLPNDNNISQILSQFFSQFAPGFRQADNSAAINHVNNGNVPVQRAEPAQFAEADVDPEMPDLFSNADPLDNQIINTDNSGLEFPKIFEEQTKFSDPISDSMAEFVNNACTRKADVSKFLEANQIPSNCKALVPPLINSEVWSYLYANIQQRDKSLQDVQKILGLGIVPLIKMAEMMKSNQIDIAKFKSHITQALALTCNAFFEINIKRRYFIRPYVSKKFQQLCSATCPIEEHLFPKDMAKRMKEITEASQINRQIAPRAHSSKNFPGRRQPYSQRGRGYYQNPAHNRGRGRGRPFNRRGYRG